MVTEENRDMYYSLLEMEALKLRVQKIKNTIGSAENKRLLTKVLPTHQGSSLRKDIDEQFKTVSVMTKEGADLTYQKVKELPDVVSNKAIGGSKLAIKIEAKEEVESAKKLISEVQKFSREDLDDFIENVLEATKRDRRLFEEAAETAHKNDRVFELQTSELAEIRSDRRVVQQLAGCLEANMGVLQQNIDHLRRRFEALGSSK